MPFGAKKKSEKKEEKEEKEEKKEKKENKEKKKTKQNKVKPQLNPYCNQCSHNPLQSLTPKDVKKYQKEKNYNKLYKLT